MPIYCGNNATDPRVVSGTHVLGTNYQCLRKGIAVGRHLPYDASYTQPHVPIDGRRFYCGNAPVLPAGGGYFANGSASKCLQNGVGVGKAQRAAMGPPAAMYFIRFVLPYLLFFFIVGGIFLIFYFTKPKFLKMKKNMKNVIDWSKFIPYYLVVCLVVAIIIWWFWKKFVRRWV